MFDVTARGRRLGPFTRTWSPTEAVVYALGVGAGPEALEYVVDNDAEEQRVLPTFAAVLARNPPPVWVALGLASPTGVLHTAHGVRVYRRLPPEGTVTLTFEVTEIWDKGDRGAVFIVNANGVDSDGERILSSRFTGLARGAGGFGGERGPSLLPPEPVGEADIVVSQGTLPQQALLYRLSGDRNPLHCDPSVAAQAGFERPILHGLCTYGFVGRALLGALAGAETTGLSGTLCNRRDLTVRG